MCAIGSFGIKRDGAIGADDGRIGAAALQGGFGQERPGGSIVRRARQHIGANPLGRRQIAARKRALRASMDRRRLARMRRSYLQARSLHEKVGQATGLGG